jgi:hypothetical protein
MHPEVKRDDITIEYTTIKCKPDLFIRQLDNSKLLTRLLQLDDVNHLFKISIKTPRKIS